MGRKTKNWFNGAVVYQIYPRSFKDSDGDGVGDLKGVIQQLDYLAGSPDSLNVTAIWLCPFYKSPMADFGYDISDYYSVDPVFGSLDDFRELVDQAHARGLKVLVDLVANHTSDQHPWFIESKSSRHNQRRDWYIWHDGKAGGPPNDWLSVFGGPAWQYDEASGQYYLHSFSVHQPDLNWENRQVRQAIMEVMRFWLDLGVDGFRADAVYWLSKDHRFRNDPPVRRLPKPDKQSYERLEHIYSRKGPRLYRYLRELAKVLDNYKGRFMVVEAYPESGKQVADYLKFYRYVDRRRLAPFNFEGIYEAWKAPAYKNYIDQFQAALKTNYVPVYTFGNHDKPRLASRIGAAAAPPAAVLLLTLPGMAFMYYGEEIGMEDVPIPQLIRKDPLSLHGEDRDKERTPMQWDGSKNAGFSTGEPWLPIPKSAGKTNTKSEFADRQSLLNLYRSLLGLRNSSKTLRYGKYLPQDFQSADVFGFIRQFKRQKLLVLINFTSKQVNLDNKLIRGRLILSSYQDHSGSVLSQAIDLRPNEAVIIKL